ncbi:MAG: sensor histidine kinase [Sphingopyxis sp.]
MWKWRRAIISAEQRENARRIDDLKDRLARANTLSTLGQIAAGVGHEINQPLTVIGMRADNARRLMDTGRTADAHAALDDIVTLTRRIGTITGELRRFSRRADRRIGTASITAALAGMQLLLGDRITKTGTALTIHSTPPDIQVVGEQGRLEQVLVNLVQNALDALDAAGATGAGGAITITAMVDGPAARISIVDSGPGIPPEIAQQLFTPFSTSKPDGLGLGLVISRDIMMEFGGELALMDSATGAHFMLTVPLAPTPAGASMAPAGGQMPPSGPHRA